MLPSAVLLPTPTRTNASGNRENNRGETLLPGALLPTPTTEPATGNGHARNLGREAGALLATPTAMDSKASGGDPSTSNVTLTDAVVRRPERFGQYAAAVARWEQISARPAPEPTEATGKRGAHRLSPVFVEWMMGLPAGWVTDVPDLTRNEQLKMLGNGVVPQQAAVALRHLLEVRAVATGAVAA